MISINKEPKWENFLLNNQPNEVFKKYYAKRLKEDDNNYWQILAEAETAYLFHKKFNISVIGFNKKTKKSKDVDLFAKLEEDDIYIEVTTMRYKEGLNNDQQQDAKLERALEHASEKFLDYSINLLVVYDEQLYSLFYDPKFISSSVINHYFNCNLFERNNGNNIDLRKISGLLLFGQRKYSSYDRDLVSYENNNAFNKMSDVLFNHFDGKSKLVNN